MTHRLRDYQQQAVDDTFRRWGAGARRVPVVMATGLGKSVVAAHAAKRFLEENPGKRVLSLAHTDELCSQMAAHMRRTLPGVPVGVVKAGENETHCRVIVSSRQTLQAARRREQIKNVGLLIYDEAHHCTRAGTAGAILDHFGAFAGDLRMLGLTATLVRGDKQKLSSVWEPVTFSRDILFGIRRGYLLDVTGQRVVVPDLNLANVKKVAGDFSDESLAAELERTFAVEIVAEKYKEVAPDRKGIAFFPTVATSYHAAEAFNAVGIPSEVVHGGLNKNERRAILKRFHAGQTRVICNCAVLTEGWDEPTADVCVIARPTRSPGLFVQMAGRVLRPDLTVEAGQRPKALILSAVPIDDFDLCNLTDLSPERKLQRDEDEELSLLELELQLEEYEQKAEEFADPTYVAPYAGDTEVQAFDPLHRERAWQQTAGGTYFMSAGGDAYVFLAESWQGDPGTYDVVWCSKDARRPEQGLTQYLGLPLEEALLCAEDEAISRGGHGTKTLTSRKSAWRREQPTEAQLKMARWHRISANHPDGKPLSRGEVSERIDLAVAGGRIDPLVARVMANR